MDGGITVGRVVMTQSEGEDWPSNVCDISVRWIVTARATLL